MKNVVRMFIIAALVFMISQVTKANNKNLKIDTSFEEVHNTANNRIIESFLNKN